MGIGGGSTTFGGGFTKTGGFGGNIFGIGGSGFLDFGIGGSGFLNLGGKLLGGNGKGWWPKLFKGGSLNLGCDHLGKGGNLVSGGCLKWGQKNAEAQVTGENFSFFANPNVCFSLIFVFKTIFEDSKPS